MRKTLIFLFLLSFLVFNLNINRLNKGDTTPARLLPLTILTGKGIYLDEFQKKFPPQAFYEEKMGEHFVSTYPMMEGFLSVPVYLPFYIYSQVTHQNSLDFLYNASFDLEKLTASLFTALSVVLFFALLEKIFKSKKLTLILALIFAFATPTFSISSQQLWQHGIANLFTVISFSFLYNFFSEKKKGALFWSLVFAVLAFFSRDVFAFYLLAVVAVSVAIDRKNSFKYVAVTLFGIAAYVVLNLSLYGTIVGTEATPVSAFNPFGVIEAFLGLLFSPGRGMLFYTPIFFLSAMSIFFFKKKSSDLATKYFFNLCYFCFVALIVFYSFWGRWWAGATWGDRFIADVSVPGVILLGYFYISCRGRLARAIFFLLAIVSFLTQVVGVFYYPRGHFDDYPNDVDVSVPRVWDLTDNPISRNLLVGPEFSRLYQVYYLLNGIDSRLYGPNERACDLRKTGERMVLGNRIVDLELTNKSKVSWVTSSKNPLKIRQLFFQERRLVNDSPIPSTPLPPVIKPGDVVRVSSLVVPPDNGAYTVSISPVQEAVSSVNGSWWAAECRVLLTLN